jgi:hypothetical protein
VIYIDFVPGTHGKYLEHVCNKYLTESHSLADFDIFDSQGRAHRSSQEFIDNKTFDAQHLCELAPDVDVGNQVIRITFESDDMFYLTDRYLSKAGAHPVDVAELATDTYHKLNNAQHRPILDNLIAGWCQPQWYTQVKQAQQQQLEICNLIRLDEHYPDCPEWVLREFYKINFDNQSNGLTQRLRTFDPEVAVFYFPLRSILHSDGFVNKVIELAAWLDLDIHGIENLVKDHNHFLRLQPIQRDQYTTAIITDLVSQINRPIAHFDWLQQAWIWHKTEWVFEQRLTNIPQKFYNNTSEILEALDASRH